MSSWLSGRVVKQPKTWQWHVMGRIVNSWWGVESRRDGLLLKRHFYTLLAQSPLSDCLRETWIGFLPFSRPHNDDEYINIASLCEISEDIMVDYNMNDPIHDSLYFVFLYVGNSMVIVLHCSATQQWWRADTETRDAVIN